MKAIGKKRIALIVGALFAGIVLLVTYGTVLPSFPFASIKLDSPTVVDSDGEFTVVVDSASCRALIMNADGNLTGVVSCETADSPFDAITDACVSDGYVYLSGVRFEPDSDAIKQERVAVYDKGGNPQFIVFEKSGIDSVIPMVKAVNETPGGIILAVEHNGFLENMVSTETDFQNDADADADETNEPKVVFQVIDADGMHEAGSVIVNDVGVHDAAFSTEAASHYAILSVRGVLGDDEFGKNSTTYAGHVFTSVEVDDEGTIYVCDDVTGALCVIDSNTPDVRTLVAGEGFDGVNVNSGIIGLCNTKAGKAMLCDLSGAVKSEFTEVWPSIGFSARMLLVWICGLYLAVLAIVFMVRKLRRLVREGKTEGIGPMFTAIAVVAAVVVVVGNISYASYETSVKVRLQEIDMCADYLESYAPDLSEQMEKANNRSALRGDEDEFIEAYTNLIAAVRPALVLVSSANSNGIGMYFTVYGIDDAGVFYLDGSSAEYVLGTSVRDAEESNLQKAFKGDSEFEGKPLLGKTLRDDTLYRLVRIPTSDGQGVAGVIEIGSKVRSFESSITGNLTQRILTLLILVLVVYLAYSELRACGRCLFSYQQRRQEDAERSVALLTRPFTLAITILASIDSVMTVLIARDLLIKTGLSDSSPLLGVPAVMLGVGMIIGQGLYSVVGARVGLRRLVISGAIVMVLCACCTALAVASELFWLYCVAKLLMAVPFGMLYTLGYSLPRVARDDETRALAAGGVKRTDTSAAALGTVLGGYAAQVLGNVWVYALVAAACLPIILMALNLLPKGMVPLEKLAQPDSKNGRIRDFVKTPAALAIALLVVLPATVAAGYASFLFPLFSSDLGLSKADVNNIFVLGQLVVYVCIDSIDAIEARRGKWRVSLWAVLLIGVVFLLFAINTTLVWSVAVVAIVAVLGKCADGWKAMWQKAAGEVGVPAERAVGAMFATRSLALVAQPFILSSLLGATEFFAVLAIGLLCLVCAALFYVITRKTSLAQ